MNTKLLFQNVSKKMQADFDVSAEINHSGSKGTVRENFLRKFLAERLPFKYGLGSGEIVGRVQDTSRQSDVIVFDKLNGVHLFSDDSMQVFPIDCVYGVIEVKSALSKAELFDGLDKIKLFKSMKPEGNVTQSVGGGFTLVTARPSPFGMIFAYKLADNSLQSLWENLAEWESKNSPEHWPNYICVLDIGTIYHQTGFERSLDSIKISKKSVPVSPEYGKDSLFEFFCALHDICANMTLGPVSLSHYAKPAVRVGKYIINGLTHFDIVKPNTPPKTMRLSEAALDKVVNSCDSKTQITYGEFLKKAFGNMPLGLEGTNLSQKFYLYNPDNLPGLHEIGDRPIEVGEMGPYMKPSLANAKDIEINGKYYIVTMSSFNESDFEEIGP